MHLDLTLPDCTVLLAVPHLQQQDTCSEFSKLSEFSSFIRPFGECFFSILRGAALWHNMQFSGSCLLPEAVFFFMNYLL